MPRLAVVQQIVGVLCLCFVALVIVANLSCAPKYFQRGDVIALLAIGLADAVLLLGASWDDSDVHRFVGSAASASAAALFLSTISIPALAAPLALAGVLRLPRSRTVRIRLAVGILLAILLTVGLVALGLSFVSAEQARCP